MVQVTRPPNDDTAVLTSPAHSEHTNTTSVVEDAYRGISRAMMADQLNIADPQVNLDLMNTALKNRNTPLAKNRIDQLSSQINKDLVLKVLTIISKWIYPNDNESFNFEPSAPPLVDNDDERNDNWMLQPLNQLREKCFLMIDSNGDFVLKKKEVENLHYNDLRDIAFRDTLVVSSELVVYSAIMRWYNKQCEIKLKDRDDNNAKSILKDLVYATRYGLMSEKEFLSRTIEGHKGPDRMGMLGEKETNEIIDYIKQRKKKKKDLHELPYKMSLERRDVNLAGGCNSNVESYLINFLSCWTAVFD